MKPLYLMGNWKMSMTAELFAGWQTATKALGDLPQGVTVVLFPPDLLLSSLHHALPTVKLGVQRCSDQSDGAHTGETSAFLAKALGATYCLCGHSERRRDQRESDELIALQVKKAQEAGLKPVLCVGEDQAQRESGKALDVIAAQLAPYKGITDLIVAYEPVWAIGTGLTATPAQAEEVAALIVKTLGCPCLYGGSVNASNGKDFFAMPHISGALVGGASCKPETFFSIL